MSVLGVTAVEDELQDCIKEDIEFLRNGGITVAMATGDKKETAMIIARNCGLLNDSMKVFDLTGHKTSSSEQLEQALNYADYKLYLKKLEYDKKNGGFRQVLALAKLRNHSQIFTYRRGSQEFLGGPVVKNPPANAGNVGLIPGPGRSHMPRGN